MPSNLNKKESGVALDGYGKEEDVGNLVEFLLSSKSSHITGQNMLLDGGESVCY